MTTRPKLTHWFSLGVTGLSLGSPAMAQNGDKAGEEQPPPPAHWAIPPSPVLTPEQALASFRIAPGFQVELVASEPLIESPVAVEFDPDGRLFVLEMRGFMRTVDGRGEEQPTGRVSVLEDTNGDGRMDKGTVFAEGFVLPRAMALVRGGLLVAEPPRLWFLKDSDGDGKADEKTEVSADYGNQSNPEHTANSLTWGRDNWIYSANHTTRYRNLDGNWEKEPTFFRGQWGLSQDDYGRLFFNSNSDPLRADFVPAQYLMRNQNFKTPVGGNAQVVKDLEVWPARMNPGVNRGYQKGQLREDGTLRTFTGACGPCVYRGEAFPPSFYGAGFICEPTGNLVRCNLLSEERGSITGTNAYVGKEFLASIDERFRPVNLHNGPDGALYVVDMYRGVIQHKIYLTTYLRNQALSRGLESPVDAGRIYRVVPEGFKRAPAPRLGRMNVTELVAQLKTGNGWARDAAQRLLVEKRDSAAVEPLTKLVQAGRFPSAVYALSVLDGMGDSSSEAALAGLSSQKGKVRAAAIRYGEPFLRAEGMNPVARKILAATRDESFDTRLQLAFSLGESRGPEAEHALLELIERDIESPLVRSAALSGLAGRELTFLGRLLARPAWTDKSDSKEQFLRDLARCVAESRDTAKIAQLLDVIAADGSAWRPSPLVQGFLDLIPPAGKGKTPPPPKPVRFAVAPKAYESLRASAHPAVKASFAKLDTLVVWPGKPGYVEAEVKPLTAEEKARFDAGKELYLAICGACHQPTGIGLEGLAPPLVDADWVTGSPARVARLILQGVRGPLNVKGKTWSLEMPPLNVLDDEQIAAVMTYVRREWGHTASPVDAAFVAKVRAETEQREDAWTEAELLKVP